MGVAPVVVFCVSTVSLAFSALFIPSPPILPNWEHSALVFGMGLIVLAVLLIITIAIGRRTRWSGGQSWVLAYFFLVAASFGVSYRVIGYINMAYDSSVPETKLAVLVESHVRSGKQGGSGILLRGLQGNDTTSLDGSMRPRSIGGDERNVPVRVKLGSGALFPWVIGIERDH